ncbi:MAG TPA: carbonic anhydrase family protein [Candidatus Acidoferrum sp.]|nr:carbonic anhydrase family protein [Candidatus Acidoferrum sp.]
MSQISFRKTFFLTLGFSLFLLPAFAVAQEATPHWSYDGASDPGHWGSLGAAFAACSTGHMQSPINIKDTEKTQLQPLMMNYKAVPLNIIDNGHTVQITYPGGSTLSVNGVTYTLKQFHFHHPAEEHVNGKKYDLVAHLVHADAGGNLAVIAVLFTKGAPNPLFDNLWKNLPTEQGKAATVASVSVNVTDLVPQDTGYFHYMGSLTAPPCSEGVTWFVLKTPMTISAEQLAVFAKLYPHNARPIQPTNGRKIEESK